MKYHTFQSSLFLSTLSSCYCFSSNNRRNNSIITHQRHKYRNFNNGPISSFAHHYSHHSSKNLTPLLQNQNNFKTQSVSLYSTTSADVENSDGSAATQNYATSYHAPVMVNECIDAMLRNPDFEKTIVKKKKYNKNKKRQVNRGDEDIETETPSDSTSKERQPLILVDATLGGGGHSTALLEQMKPGDILIGCDVDMDALLTASQRLEKYMVFQNPFTSSSSSSDDDNVVEKKNSSSSKDDSIPSHPIFIPVQSNFRYLHEIIPDIPHPYIIGKNLLNSENEFSVDGILMDLGVSSHQIDSADRGFAFLKDGPLDMRMSGTSSNSEKSSLMTLTAADLCNELDERELIRILKTYGDEPRARQITQAIIQSRPLSTTNDLHMAVSKCTPEFAKKGRRMGRNATLARVFQALRIVVNEEDKALIQALEEMSSTLLCKERSRLVILSYHSMEDRMVKRIMRDGTVDKQKRVARDYYDRDMYGNYIGEARPWVPLGKKRKATPEEIEANSRARSATLRVAERVTSSSSSD